jgi:hypothetical protein
MVDWMSERLRTQTGTDVSTWKGRIAAQGFESERELRAWLSELGVTYYPQQLLVYETFGYPAHLQMAPEQLIDRQYADRPSLRPILDRILEELPGLDSTVVQARKTFIALVGPKRTFAAVQPTTQTRVDLGLRLDGVSAGPRLVAAKSISQSSMTHEVGLRSQDDVDAEVIAWLRRASEANK